MTFQKGAKQSLMNYIEVIGARVHNLKNINVKIPHKKLTVITGLSGSGKSSLAFDTIYAEGQRRYLQTFSAYARQFLGMLQRPDVDKISGLAPVIAIEQKTTNKNPRSTVGTVTEIYDFLRLWFARASEAYSYVTGEKMVRYSDNQILELIRKTYKGKRVLLLAPVVKSRKGHYKELFERFAKLGFLQARVDGELIDIEPGLRLERYKTHSIEIVIDRLKIPEKETDKDDKRIKSSINLAMHYGKGVIIIMDKDTGAIRYFSRKLMCPTSGISYDEPEPNTFSFNSPQGYCPRCKGLGYIEEVDIDKILPDTQKSIYQGAIKPLGKYRANVIFWQIEAVLKNAGFDLHTPVKDLPDGVLHQVLYGTNGSLRLTSTPLGSFAKYYTRFEGVVNEMLYGELSEKGEKLKDYLHQKTCPVCGGARLKQEALYFKIDGKNIAQLAAMDLEQLYQWLDGIEERLSAAQRKISEDLLKEIRGRLRFLLDVGLGYLSLDRPSATLSGGESQRIRLATQIGSQLVNVLYILDEPSIGLHPQDNERLIESLKRLRDLGNTVIVVEHDEEIMRKADYIVDLGPGAGRHGGSVVASGTPAQLVKSDSLTAQFLSGRRHIAVPSSRRAGNGKYLEILGASGHNLKNVDVKFPLGTFICVTGVSGSGKSTLINDTLYPILAQKLYNSKREPLSYRQVKGLEYINKAIVVDQTPLGRTPRSNPATYTKVFNEIRSIFAQTPLAKMRGYTPGRFSFNIKGGRCEVCKGAGVQVIEMKLMPDVYVTCSECGGKRYNAQTLEVRYKGKSIADVLDMSVNEALEFFENYPKIKNTLQALKDVGLGYIKLGQSSTTLSGGEAQRVKLAAELAKKATGKTIYILDEPTTGMHFADIEYLLHVIHKLVDKGNTVIVIEHNLDVIKNADWIIDLGPAGGRNGGQIICTGTPEDVAKCKNSATARYLRKVLE